MAAAGLPFVIVLGAGGFGMSLSANWSALARTIRGQGLEATSLDIQAQPQSVTDGDGANGFNLTIELLDLEVLVNAQGGFVLATDGGTYTAGDGGDLSLFGRFKGQVLANGGSADAGSSAGDVSGGNGGAITLSGFQLNADQRVNASGGADVYGAGTVGDGGTVEADLCHLRFGDVLVAGNTDGEITLSRCLHASGIGTITDKGGNAVW